MSHNAWTKQEDQYLKDNFQTTSAKLIGKELNRSYDGVRRRASILKVKKGNHYWTVLEVEFLRINYGKIDFKELRKTLKKSKHAVHAKYRKIKSA